MFSCTCSVNFLISGRLLLNVCIKSVIKGNSPLNSTKQKTPGRAHRKRSPQQPGSLNPRANEREALARLHKVGAAGRILRLSPLQYTSAWHRLSHSGLRRRVRVCARTSKQHSTHLLIRARAKERKTGTLSSIAAGNSPLPALCSLLGD